MKAPHLNVDATNKEYVDKKIHEHLQQIKADFKVALSNYSEKITGTGNRLEEVNTEINQC